MTLTSSGKSPEPGSTSTTSSGCRYDRNSVQNASWVKLPSAGALDGILAPDLSRVGRIEGRTARRGQGGRDRLDGSGHGDIEYLGPDGRAGVSHIDHRRVPQALDGTGSGPFDATNAKANEEVGIVNLEGRSLPDAARIHAEVAGARRAYDVGGRGAGYRPRDMPAGHGSREGVRQPGLAKSDVHQDDRTTGGSQAIGDRRRQPLDVGGRGGVKVQRPDRRRDDRGRHVGGQGDEDRAMLHHAGRAAPGRSRPRRCSP